MPASTAAAWRTIRAAARGSERDRYLSALLAPRAARDDLVAIAAFLGDIARIPRTVSDPRLGAIRLQWWADTVEGFAEGAPPTGHPLADALGELTLRHGLANSLLADVIDARFTEFDDAPFLDEAAMLHTLARAEGGGFRLAASVLDGGDSPDARAAFDAAGVAFGLVRVFASLPRQMAHRRLLLPASWPETGGLARSLSSDEAPDAAVRALIARGAVLARSNLQIVQEFSARQAARATHSFNAAVLPCALVGPQLQALERWNLSAARPAAEFAPLITPLTRVWRLWRAHRRGCV
ncbi:MAG: squalene/phytoene synthase family protein [Hyphomicrobium sp.]